MPRFSKNTITELGGVDAEVIASELLWGTDQFYNIEITDDNGVPIDITNWTSSFRLIRRKVDAVVDGRYGLELVNLRAAPMSQELILDSSVIIVNPLLGLVRLLVEDTFFSQVQSPIDSVAPPVYSGYLQFVIPAVSTVGSPDYIPAQKKKILLCFIVRNDGVRG